ncbi:MAG: acetylserotonin O-methyltransferase [Fimbriimonadales bacterium]|nr:acetylserotonin O-methyltransferase [Fimbriimonadales bacterium]
MENADRSDLDRLLASARGFMEARILLTAAELDVWTSLREPTGLDELAVRLHADPRGLEILLDALTATGWLLKTDGRYANTPAGARWLTGGSSESVLPYLQHMAHLWERWAGLTAKVVPLPSDRREESRQLAFIEAMHVLASRRADRTIGLLRPDESRSLLDVGGGSGTYSVAFLRANPDATATVFDLPAVATMAARRFEQEGLAGRGRAVGGDFGTDPLPEGHDLVLLSAIIHMNGTEENVRLFHKCRRALQPNGRLVVRDHLMSEDRTEPAAGALFAVNMLVATERGRTYTLAEVASMLRDAGFGEPEVLDRPGTMDDLVEARPL